MDCLEFKRIALADPGSQDVSFVEHSEQCPDCLKYVGEIKQMDRDLSGSLDVAVPADLAARLKLATEMEQADESPRRTWYAVAASLFVAVFIGGLFAGGWLGPKPGELQQDYQSLLAGVVEHINEVPMTPVWSPVKANNTVNTLLASYDTSLRLEQLDSLQFGQVCPMGRYRGLHATLETERGQTTFAYIKGEPVGEIVDAAYEGFVTRIKPVIGGNLIIVSRTRQSVDQADELLQSSMVWDI